MTGKVGYLSGLVSLSADFLWCLVVQVDIYGVLKIHGIQSVLVSTLTLMTLRFGLDVLLGVYLYVLCPCIFLLSFGT